ncbi:unnamed protein product, partial [Didymodactylos carnosus]
RRGEELVFQYLKWKYPDDNIKWLNDEQEYFLPYDIEIIRKNEKTKELIEVKATRVSDQHTFQVSIREIKWLRAHPNTYCIYRVYYAENDPFLSTITVLSRVKWHLQQKQLSLCMKIAEQTTISGD